MKQCPFCKSEIDDKADKCSHCTSNIIDTKGRWAILGLAGFMMVSFGLFFIWIPFIGIPLIFFGVLIWIPCTIATAITMIKNKAKKI